MNYIKVQESKQSESFPRRSYFSPNGNINVNVSFQYTFGFNLSTGRLSLTFTFNSPLK